MDLQTVSSWSLIVLTVSSIIYHGCNIYSTLYFIYPIVHQEILTLTFRIPSDLHGSSSVNLCFSGIQIMTLLTFSNFVQKTFFAASGANNSRET